MIRSALSIAGLAASLAAQTSVMSTGTWQRRSASHCVSALPKRCHGGTITIVGRSGHVPVGAATCCGSFNRRVRARAGVCGRGVAAPAHGSVSREWRQPPTPLPGVKFWEAGASRSR